MISANKNNVTVEVKPSAKELELITTDRRELQAIAERRKVALEHERLMVEAVGVVGRLG